MTTVHGTTPDPFPPATDPAVTWETPHGTLRVWSHASEAFILNLIVDSGFGALFRPSRYQEEFLHTARRPGGNVVLAVAEPGIIVGYILAERPVPVAWQRRVAHNRWAEHAAVVELGAIEVSRNCRRLGIADHLIDALVAYPEYQDQIIIGTIMRRYWDLTDTGMDAWQYRAALMGLLGRYGFEVYATDDPRVISEPTDALLARIGPATRPEHIELFHRLRLPNSSP